jgi:ABC-type phosphate/phosphonate transport system ATPase subunit
MYQQEPKVLILGTSDSGKSTLLKQLKIIHGKGFSDEERKESKRLILMNILTSCQSLLKHSDIAQVHLNNKEFPLVCDIVARAFEEGQDDRLNTIDETVASEITQFWNHKSTQELVKRSNEIGLLDSAY